MSIEFDSLFLYQNITWKINVFQGKRKKEKGKSDFFLYILNQQKFQAWIMIDSIAVLPL